MQILRMLAVAMAVMIATTTTAQEFRVETDVFIDNGRQPVAQHLTLFTGNLVYDFAMTRADEVTMLDTQRGRVVLMDLTKKTKTEVSTQTLLDFTAKIKQIALEKGNGVVSLEFQTQFDVAAKTIELTSDHVTYTASAIEAQQPEAVERYREFADWYARLNAVRPGNLPPFGRLRLNRELADRQWLPQSITRTLVVDKLVRRRQQASSKHLINWQLTNRDRRRIQDVAGLQAAFRSVPLETYLQLPKVAAR